MKKTFPLLMCVVFLAGSAFGWEAEKRQRVDLDGTWHFAQVMPDGSLGTQPNQTGDIQVPGIWANQGYGEPTDKTRTNFIGVGRYERTAEIPASWSDANLEPILVLEGISRYAKVFVKTASDADWKQVGAEAIGVIGSHEISMAGAVQAGQAFQLRIDVDSKQRHDVDTLYGAAQLDDYLWIDWGGLWSHVYIEGRPQVRLTPTLVRTLEIAPPKVGIYTQAVCGEAANVDLAAAVAVEAAPAIQSTQKTGELQLAVEIRELDGDVVAQSLQPITAGKAASLELAVPDGKLWTPDTPNLYYAVLRLMEDGIQRDVQTIRFGMRQIRTEGHRFLLNGKRLFLRGYGDDHIYPMEFAMPTNHEMFVKRLRLIKSYGFNHCRHHSTIMPHEYYDACDELGIMPNAEFLIGYPHFLPGSEHWLERVPKGTDPQIAMDLYKARFAQVVLEYRNHPSIFAWVEGNELWHKEGQVEQKNFQRIAKTLDPDRFFLDTDGDWATEIMDPAHDRDTVDWYTPLFNEWMNPVFHPEKFKSRVPVKPAISHETGNFTTFMRRDQAEMFQKTNFIPFWMTNGIKRLEELGFTQESDEWVLASEKLYYQLHKSNIEGIRLNDALSGYHWWLFQDYWTTSNGLVDYFYRPKSVTQAEVLQINSDLVFLQKGLKPTYSVGDTLELELLVSNYTPYEELETLRISLNGKTTELTNVALSEGNTLVKKLSEVLTLPEGTTDPQELKIQISGSVKGVDRPYQNQWSTWVFPKEQTLDSKIPVYRDTMTATKLPKWWNLPILDEAALKDPNAVLVVNSLDEDLVKALVNGARVVLLDASSFLPSLSVQYQSTWWKAGDAENQNHNGTYVPANSSFSVFAPEKYGHPGWSVLLEHACKFKVETTPGKVDTLVRGIPSLVMVQDTPIVFQVRVGKGTLVVSGLNHHETKDRPENAWALRQMVQGAPLPEDSPYAWSADWLMKRFHAQIPDGTILGFHQLITRDVDVQTWFSFRSANVTTLNCRQKSTQQTMSWYTEPVPADKLEADSATFIFSGGLGYASAPKTEGFELSAAGKTLRFDVPDPNSVPKGETLTWKSEDGSLILTFDVRRIESNGLDYLGIFRLTVPTSALKAKLPLDVTVRSLGENSVRWFAITQELDLVSP